SVTEKNPSNWAKIVAAKLAIDHTAPRDAVETRRAPDGEEWTLRLLVTDRPPELLVRPRAAEELVETEILARPAPAGQQDTNATVTALAAFAACPRKYYLGAYFGYEGRLRRMVDAEEDGELSAGDFGSQVHALLAGVAVPNPDPEAERLAAVFHRGELGRRAAQATRVEREFDFLMAVEDLVVRGQVDLWFEEGGELVLVDYKTDDVKAVEAPDRARDYVLQLRLYAMAVERVAGRAPDRAYLHFLRPDRVVEVDLAPSLLESPEQVVKDFQEAQSKLEFPLNEGERCRRCSFFKDLCPATLAGEKG
ncbi:MAG TPA: PD-(D/E)XK nuclease family protein, partial [Candidatus Acidoferrum sp.]|nr:PD-(D/E)XK nuclease family protein [Candidatus Acidoferrum sp.]